MNSRTSSVLSVEVDRGNHEVEFVGALDVARYAVGHSGLDELGVSEVEKPVNALRVAVLQQERRARGIFRPRECEHLALHNPSVRRVLNTMGNLETPVEFLPPLRQWGRQNLTTLPAFLQAF